MPSFNSPPFTLLDIRFATASALVALGEFSSSGVAALLAFGLSILLLLGQRVRASSRGPLPPGPKGLPILGNLLQLSGEPWITFTKWRSIYGPLVYLNVAGQRFVVLNDHKVTADLLDRRAGIYSDRPRWIVASEILTGGLLFVLSRYGDVWRRMRRAAHEGLNKARSPMYQPLQLKEAVYLVDGLLKDQDNWDEELKRASASMIMSVVYDAPVMESCHDPSIARVNTCVERLTRAAFPGEHLVEFFPWMRYLPSSIAKWKRNAEAWHAKDSALFTSLFNDVKNKIDHGDERPSFSGTLIRQADRHALNDKEQAWLAATLYAAGAETTAAVLQWFMLAMLKYPEVQKKCQSELDAVVGRSRMPTFADKEHLPYIAATVRECLRWKPIAPIGEVPTSDRPSGISLWNKIQDLQARQDDYYQGYFIPKGTICVANVWAMNMDPEIYGADANDFNPSRHIDSDGKLATALADTKDEGHVTFGFGRRICVGRHVATNSLFIDIARKYPIFECILWALNLGAPSNGAGKLEIPDSEVYVNEGLVLRPMPFKCVITPRFPEARAIVAETKALQANEAM